jgi:plasmid maintenance system antidote protein VapI
LNVLSTKINKILERKNLSHRKLAKMIDEFDSNINAIIMCRRAFPDHIIEKLSPILGVSVDEIKGWILADKYSQEVLKLAIEVKQENHENLILTSKMDELLQKKNLSRTAMSKVINYSQGRLNEIIIGKKPMSKTVLAKIATTLEISEDEIKSWIIADKYTLKTLKTAVIL